MKILRISQEIYPEVVGGGAYHAHALSRDQAAMGHDVTVVSIRPDINKPVMETRNGYQIIQFPSDISILGNDISLKAVRYLRSQQTHYDIIHAHAHFYFSSNIAAILSNFNDTPMAMTNHALISQSIPTSLAKIHLQTIGKYTFNSSDVVFCYTEEEKRQLQALISRPTIKTVSNGIDHHRFSPEGQEHSIINANPLAILFVGRFVNGKRPQDAIDAFNALRKKGIEATLYLCGDGPLREKLKEKVANYGLDESVRFLGMIDYDEMPKVYRAADLLVLPSRSEGFPRTVMEALSTATPVVASDLDQVGPIIQKAGRTVEPGNVAELAERMNELAEDSNLRESLGKRGRSVLIEEGLTWKKTVEETTEIMESIHH